MGARVDFGLKRTGGSPHPSPPLKREGTKDKLEGRE